MARRYKKSKRYGRRKYRAYKKRKGYKRLAKTIQRIAGVEVKYDSFFTGPNIMGPGWLNITPGQGLISKLCVPASGTGNTEMIGNNVYVRKLMIKGTLFFDTTNAVGAQPALNNLESWQMRIVLIKPYNTSYVLSNFATILPAQIMQPVAFQLGKVIIDKVYKICPTPTWATLYGVPYDDTSPNQKIINYKINVFKEMMSDPGTNIYSKDIIMFIYSNQEFNAIAGYKNQGYDLGVTVFYTDS